MHSLSTLLIRDGFAYSCYLLKIAVSNAKWLLRYFFQIINQKQVYGVYFHGINHVSIMLFYDLSASTFDFLCNHLKTIKNIKHSMRKLSAQI